MMSLCGSLVKNHMKKCKQLLVRFGHVVLVGWWFVRRPNTKGVKVLVICDEQILLVKPSYGRKRWQIPGGGVKHGEPYEVAAARELCEETGLKVDLQYLGSFAQRIEFKHDTVYIYTGRVTDRSKVHVDGVEIVDFCWVNMDDLSIDVSPSVRKIIGILK